MRSILVVVLLLSLALSVSAGGVRFPTFASTSPLQSTTLPTKFEELPEETLPTRQLEDIVNKNYVDQEILQPKTIYQVHSHYCLSNLSRLHVCHLALLLLTRLLLANCCACSKPILQQRLVYAPVIRTRVVHQVTPQHSCTHHTTNTQALCCIADSSDYVFNVCALPECSPSLVTCTPRT